jgi:hypothetical protein
MCASVVLTRCSAHEQDNFKIWVRMDVLTHTSVERDDSKDNPTISTTSYVPCLAQLEVLCRYTKSDFLDHDQQQDNSNHHDGNHIEEGNNTRTSTGTGLEFQPSAELK